MSPYERGSDGKVLNSHDAVKVNNPKFKSHGTVVIVNENMAIADPGQCGAMYLGDISEDGKKLVNPERITKSQLVDKKSVSYSTAAKPAVIWRPTNNAENTKS